MLTIELSEKEKEEFCTNFFEDWNMPSVEGCEEQIRDAITELEDKIHDIKIAKSISEDIMGGFIEHFKQGRIFANLKSDVEGPAKIRINLDYDSMFSFSFSIKDFFEEMYGDQYEWMTKDIIEVRDELKEVIKFIDKRIENNDESCFEI